MTTNVSPTYPLYPHNEIITFYDRTPQSDGFKRFVSEGLVGCPDLSKTFQTSYAKMKEYLRDTQNNAISFHARKQQFTLENIGKVLAAFNVFMDLKNSPSKAGDSLNIEEAGMHIEIWHRTPELPGEGR